MKNCRKCNAMLIPELQKKDTARKFGYHYICKNAICIGHIIENIKNKFGLTPADYCSISKKFYSFNE